MFCICFRQIEHFKGMNYLIKQHFKQFYCLYLHLLYSGADRTNVASVGSVFNDTRKVKVLSLPETIKEKSTFPAKTLRREGPSLEAGEWHACFYTS